MISLKGPQYDIVSFARGRKDVTRPILAGELALSLPTVSLAVRPLIDREVLLRDGFLDSSGGRRAEVLKMNPDFLDAIGLWVSMSGIIGVVADLGGNVVSEERLNWNDNPSKDDILEGIFHIADSLRGNTDRAPVGIGVGITGNVSQSDGVSVRFPYVDDWHDIPVKALLEDRMKLPVSIDNDVKASTFAELRFGEGQSVKNFLYVFIGKGIGLGMVFDGKLYHGAGGNAGELGHLAIDSDGALCHCGNYGCLETVAGPPAIVRQVKDAIDRGAVSAARGENGAEVTISSVLAAAETGDRVAQSVVEKAAERIGLALANTANLFDPETIVLGGLLSSAYSGLIDTIRRAFSAQVLPSMASSAEIKASKLGDVSGALGAADMVFENHIKSLRRD